MKRALATVVALFTLTACSHLKPDASAPVATTPTTLNTPEVTEQSPPSADAPEESSSVAETPSAQVDETLNAQIFQQTVQMALQVCQQRQQMSSSMLQMAQQVGDQQNQELCQQELEMHQAMHHEIQGYLENSRSFTDTSLRNQAMARLQEYDYRSNSRDMRPTSEIQSELAQYKAYAAWKAGTPEGQAAHQAGLDAQRQNTEAMTARHNARMNDIRSQAEAHNSAWARNQRINDERHSQYVHSINEESEYVNPNTNQRYWVPNEVENPTVTQPDGTQTDLQPYTPR